MLPVTRGIASAQRNRPSVKRARKISVCVRIPRLLWSEDLIPKCSSYRQEMVGVGGTRHRAKEPQGTGWSPKVHECNPMSSSVTRVFLPL